MNEYRIILANYHDKVRAMQGLRKIRPHKSLQEIKALVESLPIQIWECSSSDEAHEFTRRMEAAGFTVKVEEHFRPFSENKSDFLTWADDNRVKEAYWFSHLPSFGCPISIRIWQTETGDLWILAIQGDAPYLYTENIVREVQWNPSMVMWQQLVDLIGVHAFWESKSWENGLIGCDGTTWKFEGYRNEQYKMLECWEPTEGAAYEVGKFFHAFIPDDFDLIMDLLHS